MTLSEATMFESGSNTWRSYDTLAAEDGQHKSLYLQPDGKLSFEAPTASADSAFSGYVSDPQGLCRTVRVLFSRPTTAAAPTGTPGSWRTSGSFTTAPMSRAGRPRRWIKTSSLAGNVVARLFAATTGSDADWVVKLIDVFPDRVPADEKMGGYQLMVSKRHHARPLSHQL